VALCVTLTTFAFADQPAAPAASASAAPALPSYFSGANDMAKPPVWPDPTGAAAGVWATPAGDGKGDVPSALAPTDLYDRITHNMFSINMVWAMVTGFLVMFMQAGFAMVETGMCRAKNAGHTFAMNFMIYPLGCLGFWAYGFAFGWGNWFNGPFHLAGTRPSGRALRCSMRASCSRANTASSGRRVSFSVPRSPTRLFWACSSS